MSKKRIYVAGHRGMVGSAICRQLAQHENMELVVRTHEQLDLTSQSDVMAFFAEEKLIRYIWPQPKLAVFMQTIRSQQNLFTRI